MKLLIIEDERELSDSIVAYLSSENYLCEQAFTCDEAKEKVELYDYDCVLLDLMLPGGNGLDILRNIRNKNNPVGVIIVSAKDSLEDKVRGVGNRSGRLSGQTVPSSGTKHAYLCHYP